MPLELLTTDTQLQGLRKAHDAARASSTTVKVDRAALLALLTDHHTLYSVATGPVQAGGKRHTVKLGPDQASMSDNAAPAANS